jgi:TonB-linked SusC/RagA family outer membrane protein
MKKLSLLIVLFVFSITSLLAQTIVITGTVTSSVEGEGAVPGVSVSAKGTTIGAITDVKGKYTITIPKNTTTLVFSYIGMKKQEIEISGKSVIDCIMEPDVLGLDEVVVTALGISREKKSLGYAVQDVSGDKINDAKTGNVLTAITAKVAGVNITSSAGVAGASSFINIRGQNSILGNNQPLFVVDGVPIDNSMSYSGNPDDGINNLGGGVAYSNRAVDLNPDDIETISVLKGGAATALYGMRAGNGAVIITTKKGSSSDGRMNVSFSSSVAFDKISQMPEMQMMYAQGSGGAYSTTTPYSFGPKISDMRFNGSTTYPRDLNGKLVLATDPTATSKVGMAYNNIDNFFHTGLTVNNDLSLSGGNKDASYYMSIGNQEQKGVIPNNTFRKTSVRISGESKLGSKVKISGSANYIHSGGDRIQQGSNTSGVMLGLLRGTPTFDISNGHGKDGYKFADSYMYEDGTQRSYISSYDNPNWSVNKNLFTDHVDRLISYVGLTYDVLPNLTVNYKLGNDIYFDRRSGHLALYSTNLPDGQQEEDHHFSNDINSDLIINYTKNIIPDLSTSITVGQNMFQSSYQQLYTLGTGLVVPDFYQMKNTLSNIVRESVEKYRTAALYADLQFTYKNMVYLGFTGRNEWSTTLPKSNNSFFFPSASVGFIFSELPALKGNKILSYGKLRASIAQIANHAEPYNTTNVFVLGAVSDGWASGVSFPFNNVGGFIPNNVLANPNIKPESLLSREVGIELKLLNNRIGFDFTYYNNQNRDLLISVPLTGSSGFNAQYMNAATMENKGIEIMGNIVPVSTHDFNWGITVNFTKNKNTVLSLAPGVTDIELGGFTGSTINVVAGEAYGSMFSTGFWKDDQGRVIINDTPGTAGYGYPIKNETMKSLGSIAPKWTMGITNEFSYKGIGLSFLLDIKHGGIMWNGTRSRLMGFGTAKDTEKRGSAVVFEGVKGHITDGALVTSGVTNDIQTTWSEYYFRNIGGGSSPSQEQFVEKTDWTRLREVTISYNFGNLLKSSFVKQLRVYATGRNLWLDTPYTGIDPETNLFGASNTQGLDYFNMPNTKSYVFGVKLDF